MDSDGFQMVVPSTMDLKLRRLTFKIGPQPIGTVILSITSSGDHSAGTPRTRPILVTLKIQDDTSDLHGVSQPVISNTCKKVAGILARMSHRFIKMPSSLDEQEAVMRKFRSITDFPTVIGAIDCTHIHIKKIRTDEGQLYINRKGFPSINVQVVCDADLKIMDIVARWRGSVHDSRIFRECRLKQRFEAGAFSGILLGDSGYPCTPYLFTPLLNPRTEAEQWYNRSHIRTRNTGEMLWSVEATIPLPTKRLIWGH